MEDGITPPNTNVIEGQPETVYVQGVSNPGFGGQYQQTQAVAALVLSIVGLMMCGLCTAIPGVIMANSALQVTKNQPGHPDAGLAKSAQIVGWITIGLWIVAILFYLFIIVLAIGLEAS